MIRKILLGFAGLVLSTTILAAYSQVDQQGWYIDGHLGYGKVNGTPSTGTNPRNSGLAWGGDLGYQINRYFGAELGGNWMPKIKVDSTTANSLTAANTNYFAHLAIKGFLPFGLGHRGNLYAKLGGAYSHVNVKNGYTINGITGNKGAFAPYSALGISWAVYPNIRVFAQAEGILKSSSVPAMYLGTIGLLYYF